MSIYSIKVPHSVQKDVRKLHRRAQDELAKHLTLLASNPQSGESLHGALGAYWKYAFSLEGIEYRIVYQVLTEEQVIVLVMIGSRENSYQKLRHRLK